MPKPKETKEKPKEKPKPAIPSDVKKELLEKTSSDGYHSIEEAQKKLEGKIPVKKPEPKK